MPGQQPVAVRQRGGHRRRPAVRSRARPPRVHPDHPVRSPAQPGHGRGQGLGRVAVPAVGGDDHDAPRAPRRRAASGAARAGWWRSGCRRTGRSTGRWPVDGRRGGAVREHRGQPGQRGGEGEDLGVRRTAARPHQVQVGRAWRLHGLADVAQHRHRARCRMRGPGAHEVDRLPARCGGPGPRWAAARPVPGRMPAPAPGAPGRPARQRGSRASAPSAASCRASSSSKGASASAASALGRRSGTVARRRAHRRASTTAGSVIQGSPPPRLVPGVGGGAARQRVVRAAGRGQRGAARGGSSCEAQRRRTARRRRRRRPPARRAGAAASCRAAQYSWCGCGRRCGTQGRVSAAPRSARPAAPPCAAGRRSATANAARSTPRSSPGAGISHPPRTRSRPDPQPAVRVQRGDQQLAVVRRSWPARRGCGTTSSRTSSVTPRAASAATQLIVSARPGALSRSSRRAAPTKCAGRGDQARRAAARRGRRTMSATRAGAGNSIQW